jgi:hypothetical protein
MGPVHVGAQVLEEPGDLPKTKAREVEGEECGQLAGVELALKTSPVHASPLQSTRCDTLVYCFGRILFAGSSVRTGATGTEGHIMKGEGGLQIS